eukprot:CAMPEP_0118952274 /NCGR_PEP_ID=MMETSP1169-20130426/54572_1 /TAXON_ID=36882 /ORGANISM="Pyramimonas obovata, Strain CCMP722" /LENGTH=111 /DNA_ID=CAMNT_0006899483 /DNA_START=207 /DNA_END=539 /DNA_ORIENTATION=+
MPYYDINFFGKKVSLGAQGLVQNVGNGLMSVNALLSDSKVRQKAGDLLSRTAQQVGHQMSNAVAPKSGRKRRADRRKKHFDENECDLQVGAQLYEKVPIYMREQLWKSLLI